MYVKIGVAVLALILAMTVYFLVFKRRKKLGSPTPVETFRTKLESIRVDTAIEIARAEGREEIIKEEIKEIKEIRDDSERLRRLSELVNRTSR